MQSDGTVFLANQNATFEVNRHTQAGAVIPNNPYTPDAYDNPLVNGVTVGPDGLMYLALHSGAIDRWSLTSPNATFVDNYASASGTFPGWPEWHNGSLYYARGSHVYEVDPVTKVSSQFTDGTNTGVGQFEFGPDGLLYLADGTSGAIRRFDGTTGAFVDNFATGLDSPRGLVLELIPEPSVGDVDGDGRAGGGDRHAQAQGGGVRVRKTETGSFAEAHPSGKHGYGKSVPREEGRVFRGAEVRLPSRRPCVGWFRA